MKKLIYLLFTALLVLGCNTSDDNQLKNNETIENPSDDTINDPDDPDRSYNMNLSLKIKFENEFGENILDIENPLFDASLIDIDIYGLDGYQNEFPYSTSYTFAKYISFVNYDGVGYCFKLNDYLFKSVALQNIFHERKWLKYRIIFPDATEYVIKVEGLLINNSETDYYPTKIYVNDELRWEQPVNSRSEYMTLTIVK
ncbi:hypothetical protein EG240_11025 [Paenimyroides tangerinum]|uniref:Uncharacterized protein n=1 Tax=Paenimyroides tangerinum TaxID=2488728 RepID=A0A3P3W7Q2_9FLAO|nr:hypothetical protein [Paenimyroides tangerinum]RRJ89639.1 hypothetical protein EG240_11025 [Paenimyroides tangerinum]